jgi:hypothetical protein
VGKARMWISWNHHETDFAQPLTLGDKVEIFYQQALGWQLHIADILANGGQVFGDGPSIGPVRHSGFAVLQICLSYFEAIGQYERGRAGGSGRDFKDGVLSVFPKLKPSYGTDVDKLLSLLSGGEVWAISRVPNPQRNRFGATSRRRGHRIRFGLAHFGDQPRTASAIVEASLGTHPH